MGRKRNKKLRSQRFFISEEEALWKKGNPELAEPFIDNKKAEEVISNICLSDFLQSYQLETREKDTQWSINKSIFSVLLQFFLYIILSIMESICDDPTFFQSLWGVENHDHLKLLYKGEIYKVSMKYSYYHLYNGELPKEFDLKFVRLSPIQVWRKKDKNFMEKYEKCQNIIKETMKR